MQLSPTEIEYLAESLHGHYEMCSKFNFGDRVRWANLSEDERVKLRAQVVHVFDQINVSPLLRVLPGALVHKLAKSLHKFEYEQMCGHIPESQRMGDDDLDLDCDWSQGMARDRINYLMECLRECKRKEKLGNGKSNVQQDHHRPPKGG